jgi:hypothetical protein
LEQLLGSLLFPHFLQCIKRRYNLVSIFSVIGNHRDEITDSLVFRFYGIVKNILIKKIAIFSLPGFNFLSMPWIGPKRPNLELTTLSKQLLGSLPFSHFLQCIKRRYNLVSKISVLVIGNHRDEITDSLVFRFYVIVKNILIKKIAIFSLPGFNFLSMPCIGPKRPNLELTALLEQLLGSLPFPQFLQCIKRRYNLVSKISVLVIGNHRDKITNSLVFRFYAIVKNISIKKAICSLQGL